MDAERRLTAAESQDQAEAQELSVRAARSNPSYAKALSSCRTPLTLTYILTVSSATALHCNPRINDPKPAKFGDTLTSPGIVKDAPGQKPAAVIEYVTDAGDSSEKSKSISEPA